VLPADYFKRGHEIKAGSKIECRISS